MIKETSGNLLDAKTEALINAVNTVGVMGKGIAMQFRQKFSEKYFKDYKQACYSGALTTGKVHVYQLQNNTYPRYIINFPTKRHWRDPSRLEYIESGLKSLTETLQKLNVKSAALPALGCGLGGLRWTDVRLMIEANFTTYVDIEILLFVPNSI